jgi:dTDP-4-dehydrorhamnose 3,5-epimerase-like enzyme
MSMKVEKTAILDVLILTPKVFDDERGFLWSHIIKIFSKMPGFPWNLFRIIIPNHLKGGGDCEENKKQVWAPPGLAHGFSVLSKTAEFLYKVTDFYNPQDEAGIRWNDPELLIDWQVTNPKLSKKDQNLPLFKQVKKSLFQSM